MGKKFSEEHKNKLREAWRRRRNNIKEFEDFKENMSNWTTYFQNKINNGGLI